MTVLEIQRYLFYLSYTILISCHRFICFMLTCACCMHQIRHAHDNSWFQKMYNALSLKIVSKLPSRTPYLRHLQWNAIMKYTRNKQYTTAPINISCCKVPFFPLSGGQTCACVAFPLNSVRNKPWLHASTTIIMSLLTGDTFRPISYGFALYLFFISLTIDPSPYPVCMRDRSSRS